MKNSIKQHLIAIGVFLLIAALYGLPALQGNKLAAGDTMHWMGMSQEARTWYEKTGENPMWSNSMFGGMPTVTHYMRGKTNLIYPVQEFFTNILPVPINFFFIAMVCFYILMMSWKIDRRLAIGGAIVYAFAAYNLQIIAAGHNTKMFSIAYMPLVLAGMHWVYNKKWLSGAGAALFGLALMISNAMYQIDYYLLFILGGFAIMYAIQALRERTLGEFLKSSAIMVAVGLIAVGPSLDQLMFTKEYTTQTMRGGQSELTIGKKETKKDGGLDKDYAFAWSQGIGETFTLLVPNLYGGGNRTDIGTGSKTYEVLQGMGVGEEGAEQFVKNAPSYWGPQPFLAGPNYLGILVILLSVLGLITIRSKFKWALLGIAVFGIMLSWGNHFSALNYFLFDYLPMYNKFRTPSMSMVIPALMFCLLALWALHDFIFTEREENERLAAIKKAVIGVGGLCLLLGVGGSMFLSFKGEKDEQLKQQMVQMLGGNDQAGTQLFNALVDDRPSLAMQDGFRSLAIILLGAALLWLFSKKRLQAGVTVWALAALMSLDVLSIGWRYLNNDNYQSTEEFEAQFNPRPVDQQILQDKDPYYRVFDLSVDPFNDANGAYHHKLVGGYHPAKIERYQDLIENHLSGNKINGEVLNMLNTKYIVFNGNNGPQAQPNPEACGNAWFVEQVKLVKNADEAMTALNANSIGDTAVVLNGFKARNMAIVQEKDWNNAGATQFVRDSAAAIQLKQYGLNSLQFTSNNTQAGFAVFADVYYPLGWKAFIDGKETPIVASNYVLRGLHIPAGQHNIEFKFEPQSYLKWGTPTMAASILIWLVLAAGIGFGIRNAAKENDITAKHV